ncbi:MAG: hypothetical protein CL398_03735 [Acidiferrobacteraceae bacterium]|nr:hypothetical protein [Acidiferrobacteraceae bacterium]
MNIPTNRIIEIIADILPSDLPSDIRNKIDLAIQSAVFKLDLVSREEIEIQEKLLMRTREKIDLLEVRISELEKCSSTQKSNLF